MIELTLPRRTRPQRQIQQSTKRFNLGVWGRQSGKTTSGSQKLIQRPLEGPRFGHYWHILQTYPAANIVFDRYVRQFPKSSWSELWSKRPNESEMTVFLTGFREVSFKSGKEFNNLRVETLHGAIIDECREQSPELWPMVIRPMLAKYQGWADLYTTPNGFDWFYDLYEAAKLNPEEWGAFHAPSTEAWWWTPKEIASARTSMSEAQFAQEIMAEFRDLHRGKAYINFGNHNLVDENPFAVRGADWSQYLPIIVGMDFNVDYMSWHLGQRKANQIYWGDRIYLQNSHTPECAKELVERVRGHKAGVILVGDATGKARKTSAAGETDYTLIEAILQANGIKYENMTPEENPTNKDRVNTMNARFKAADGSISIFVHRTRCPELIRDCQRVTWKEGSDATLDKSDPTLTHATDSIGYPTCVLLPIEDVGGIGKMKVISRHF